MQATALQESKPEEHENHLMRLPDDLFILILTKIRQQNYKFLFRCSLISKHFASTIPLMPSVSISISPSKPAFSYSKSSVKDVWQQFLNRYTDYLKSIQPQIKYAINFLKKFNSVRSVDIVFIRDEHREAGLINWKTQFDLNMQSFVFLFAHSVVRKTEETKDVLFPTKEELGTRLFASLWGVGDSIEWWDVTSRLLVQHPMLREITIGRVRKGGGICLTNEQIVDLKRCYSPEEISWISRNRDGMGDGLSVEVKSAYIPALCLPKTGYVMNSVSLVVVRLGRRQPGEDEDEDEDGDGDGDGDGDEDEDADGDGDEDEDDVYGYDGDDYGDILNWNFDSDDEVFREAVTSILIHHKDKMKRRA